MRKIALTILIPIYNVEQYLEQCLDSVVGQSLKNLEIICINDGSTDGSLNIIKKYQRYDRRIRIINKNNSGYGDSMNRGLMAAKGEYIGIVESDDYVDPETFETLLGLAINNDADIVRSNYFFHKDSGDELYSYIETKKDCTATKPLNEKWIFYQAPAIWSAIYKRDFLRKNNIAFLPSPGASYQDTGFNFKALSSAKTIVFSKKAFLHYRVDNANSSVKSLKKIRCIQDEYREIEKYLRFNNLYKKYGKIMQATKFGAYYWNLARISEEDRRLFMRDIKKEFEAAKEEGLLKESFFVDPLHWKLLNRILEQDIESSLRSFKRVRRLEQVRKYLLAFKNKCLHRS